MNEDYPFSKMLLLTIIIHIKEFQNLFLYTPCEFMNKAYSFAKKTLSIRMKKPIDSSATFLLLMNKSFKLMNKSFKVNE